MKNELDPSLKQDEFFKKIQEMTLKLCYLYYNVSGSIRIPSPLKYAKCLAALLELVANKGSAVVPHEYYEKCNTLFFI